MSKSIPTSIISHWNHMFSGFDQSANEFYGTVEEKVRGANLKEIKVERITLSEGGIFSNKREYLQVKRSEHVFHVCAAPYGNNFFVSWWLGEIDSGVWGWIAAWPILGGLVTRFLKPITYFKLDTAGIFQTLVHGAIMETLDSWAEQKGIRPLIPDERKPIMRDLFSQLKS